MEQLLFKKGTKIVVLQDIYYCDEEDFDSYEITEFLSDGFIVKEGKVILPKGKVVTYKGLSENDWDNFKIGKNVYEFVNVAEENLFLELK